jgi:hypothetical protein
MPFLSIVTAMEKQTLNEALVNVTGRRRRRSAADFLEVLGESVRLEVLRHVPSFAQTATDLEFQLRAMGFLHL